MYIYINTYIYIYTYKYIHMYIHIQPFVWGGKISKFIKSSGFLLKVATQRIFSWDGPNIETSTKIRGPSRSHQNDGFNFSRKPKDLAKNLAQFHTSSCI